MLLGKGYHKDVATKYQERVYLVSTVRFYQTEYIN